MVKIKFKVNNDTSLDDIEKEVEYLCSVNVNEIPLNHIIKIAVALGCEYCGGNGGSQVRFKHKEVDTFNNYFGVHTIHKGKDEKLIMRVNYRKYVYPWFRAIIDKSKLNTDIEL